MNIRTLLHCSHGHIDHISGLISHAARRHLNSMRPATYYVPSALVQPLKTIASAYGQMHANDKMDNIDLKAKGVDDVINVSASFIVYRDTVPHPGSYFYESNLQSCG